MEKTVKITNVLGHTLQKKYLDILNALDSVLTAKVGTKMVEAAYRGGEVFLMPLFLHHCSRITFTIRLLKYMKQL